ncbi:MAG TPA: VWA domain-containing protein [Terriglobia bacterium]|nr:VWA domain-containing protein [Terriglobia bacterium]
MSRRRFRGDRAVACPAVLLVALAGAGVFPASPPAGAQNAATAEITANESQPTFNLRVQHNEVVVRAVVRDGQGREVTTLHKDDFRILDGRSPEVITHFTLETSPRRAPGGPAAPGAPPPAGGASAVSPAITLPSRFTALYFDDVHLEFGDLARVREAAGHYLATGLEPQDRAALFTSSGQNQIDFTADRAQLQEGLLKLHPRPINRPGADECPPLDPYEAYKFVDEHDAFVTATVQAETFQCYCVERGSPPHCQDQIAGVAESAAVRALELGANESQYALEGLERVCRRMAALPGQRGIVLVSPGFIAVTQQSEVDRIVDDALHRNIVISTLDARGLYTNVPLGDASQHVLVIPEYPGLEANKVLVLNESARRAADVLEQLADDTGGNYFHNSNDLDEGFRRVESFPAAYYLLAFTPPDLRPDGRLHRLTVTLAANPNHYSVQARRGYFAPDKAEDATTLAKEQLEQLVFSQEELHAIPIEVHTQFFKPGSGDARLSVLTHVDLRGLHFRKAEGRNLNDLTVITALFDEAGNYVTGQQKQIQFRLLDPTLNKFLSSGLNLKASLAVKPGAYLIREVVRDSEEDQISALNSQVEIP